MALLIERTSSSAARRPRSGGRARPSGAARRPQLPHFGGLDGLRGIAVVAVILYHGGVVWASGGFLGVEVFFVLSGFLITSLLVEEWAASRTIRLRAFWARRARRLLPALFVLVVVIGIYYSAAGPAQAVPGFSGDGLSALFYFSNWHQIAAGTSYFAASGPISPFQHTWSLSIEEQFYVIWPLLMLGILGWSRRRGGRRSLLGPLRLMLVLSLLGVLISAIEMGVLFDSGHGLDRVYYGTDTRATGLLAGATLALWLAIRRRLAQRTGPAADGRSDRFSRGSGLVLAALLLIMYLANGSSSWLYPYGFLLVDVGTVLLILAVVQRPRSAGARALSMPGLQALGQISYGLYLWHFPLFLWLDSTATGLSGLHLLMFRLGVTLLVSAASYVLIEQPIRQRRLPTIQVRRLAPIGAVAALVSVLIASSISVMPTAVPVATHLPKPTNKLVGADPACPVELIDQPGYGLAPVPLSQEAQFEYTSLGRHNLTWEGKTSEVFHTCPPKRVMLIGDSLAFTIGVPLMGDEQHYGVEVANAANLGCAFATRGELNVNGTWKVPDPTCQNALSTWSEDEAMFHPSEVVVEMGYRDEFDWSWGGTLVHLGQRAFDAYELQQIERYVSVLGRGGTKILFLTVPYTSPPAQADGSPAPAASPARHFAINWMLAHVAAQHPGMVSVVNIDQTISPGNRYTGSLDGQDCRFDGIHFTVFCAKLLEPQIMSAARKMIG
ncbi:MAG TPA: acyltransferase family protein [Solirubrobacteraceae bacterium]|nr:acyltransferase family protein [Solirubrobacteraceae bacterium]